MFEVYTIDVLIIRQKKSLVPISFSSWKKDLFLSFIPCRCSFYNVYFFLRNSFKHESTAKDWLKINWMFLCVMIFLVLSFIVVILLFGCHSYMMLTAQTTWEFMSRSRISYLKYFPDDENPFDQGYFKNTYIFLCYCKPRTWEKLIREKIRWK